jgi:hypothetical protein
MSNQILKHRTASISTSASHTTPTQLGMLADEGTEIPDPEVQTEAVGGGQAAAVGATMDVTLRVLTTGAAPAFVATLETYAKALTPVWVRVFGADAGYTEYGPGIVTAVFAKGRTSEPRRSSAVVRVSLAGDWVSDIMRNGVT